MDETKYTQMTLTIRGRGPSRLGGFVRFFFPFPLNCGNIPDHQTLDSFARQLFKVSKWTHAKASRFLSIGAIMESYANKVSWFTVTLK